MIKIGGKMLNGENLFLSATLPPDKILVLLALEISELMKQSMTKKPSYRK